MTLQEAIDHLNESLNDPNREWCEECRQEHEQLLDFLNELQKARTELYEYSKTIKALIKANDDFSKMADYYEAKISAYKDIIEALFVHKNKKKESGDE